MNYYLYLTNPSWTDPWIKGGPVPFSVASKYKREERGGIYTPDENLIDKSTFDVKNMGPAVRFGSRGDMHVIFENCTTDTGVFSGEVRRRYEDGMVICLSVKRSKFIARQLGKRACVKITDINRLKACVDEYTGVKGVAGLCKYTARHERDHFLKSTYDSWQQEYRLFWNGVSGVEIVLPPGMGTLEFILPEKTK